MASILNIPDCGGVTGTFNSGIPLCDKIRGNFLGLIALDAGVSFSPSETDTLANFIAALRTKTTAARGNRAYPMLGIWSNFEDQRKERTQATVGNLSNVDITLVDGLPAFALQHRKGDIFHQKLYALKNAGCTFLVVDSNYTVYGTMDGVNFTGYSTADIFPGMPFFGNNGQVSYYPLNISFASETEWTTNAKFIQATSSITSLTGLRAVYLSQVSFATNVLKLGLTGDGGTNLATLFDTEFAQSGAITVVNKTSGLACTLSVAYDSATASMAITISGTPFTGASTSDPFTVNLGTAAALAGLSSPIYGYESAGSLEVLKP